MTLNVAKDQVIPCRNVETIVPRIGGILDIFNLLNYFVIIHNVNKPWGGGGHPDILHTEVFRTLTTGRSGTYKLRLLSREWDDGVELSWAELQQARMITTWMYVGNQQGLHRRLCLPTSNHDFSAVYYLLYLGCALKSFNDRRRQGKVTFAYFRRTIF